MNEPRTESVAVEGGARQLSGSEMAQRIAGHIVRGEYLYGYTYVVSFDADGTMKGVNNVGARHFGTWSVDEESKTLTAEWDPGWDNTVCRGYDVDGAIELYDSATGRWRTTFRHFEEAGASVPT